MKIKDAEAWEHARRIGKMQFVLKKGVAAWGIPMFLMTCFFYPARSPIGYLGSIMWWIFVSTCYGFATWHFQEKAFAKFNAGQHI
jgi:hypothetical protein